MDKRTETKYIAIHCAATPYDVGVTRIRQWHLAGGYDDIGYHYVIRFDGTIETGRDEDLVGAHEPAINRKSVAICLAGGAENIDGKLHDKFNITDKQLASLRVLITQLIGKYGKDVQVVGHNEYSEKSCPTFNVPAWWAFGDIIKVELH